MNIDLSEEPISEAVYVEVESASERNESEKVNPYQDSDF